MAQFVDNINSILYRQMITRPGKEVVGIEITVKADSSNLNYPILDEQEAELLSNGALLRISDPNTFLYYKDEKDGFIETLALYAVPFGFSVEALNEWAVSLLSDSFHSGRLVKITVKPWQIHTLQN